MKENNIYRTIPSIDRLLNEPWLKSYLDKFSRDFVKSLFSKAIEQIKMEISSGIYEKGAVSTQQIKLKFEAVLRDSMEEYMKPVINCTGIIIHTNLGRAPLPRTALEKVLALGTRYMNLEFNLETGERSSRNTVLDDCINILFPGYKSVVVNNNAAAVMLVLNTFALGREVIISRGELVEIGGSFRIPDVMRKSGALLREVGTTNKTRLTDYEDAVNERTGLLMTVHPSNYKITGFTESVKPEELIRLSQMKEIPLFHDMGSGNMFIQGESGIIDEPNIQQYAASGVPIISFSGDKLLGGCQAGIIIAKPEFADKLTKNQLLRALRADKITYLILMEILKLYITGEYRKNLPVFEMLSQKKEELKSRVERLKEEIANPAIKTEIIEGDSFAGGGAAPTQPIPTILLALTHDKLNATQFAAKLRTSNPPVITRIENDRVLIDLRTVFPDEDEILKAVINAI